jgi:neopullulanase
MTADQAPVLMHKAALPYCCCDKSGQKITLRVLCSGDVDEIFLLYGDPYHWENGRWCFAEYGMYRQYTAESAGPGVWKIEIDVPPRKRLKYGFRVQSRERMFYFSENGVEPYGAEALNHPHNHFFVPFVHDVDAADVPAWARHTVWYQIFPDRFCQGNPAISPPHIENWETGVPAHRNFFGGDLAGILQKLCWLEDLGISGIYLTPVFKSPSNHKYNTQDYFAVDEHFGDTRLLKDLVAEAHRRGMRVMLDAVFNHAGDAHPFWQDVLKNQERSLYKDYFHIYRFPVKTVYPRGEDNLDYTTFAYHPGMPKWNTENPGARKYLLDAAAHWIRECDIDGWRLDVANEVSLDFWREFSTLTRSLKKDFYILGEVWHDASAWINPGYFDAAMNYPLEYAVSDFFLAKKISAARFTERLFSALSRYSDMHNRVAFNLLDSHDTDRVLTRAKGDKQALRNAFTMLFLLPGSPCIYYGTEIGMTGGGDPDNRRPMIWDEARQDTDLRRFFRNLIAFRKKFFAIIDKAVIEYIHKDTVHCWKFSGEGAALTAVYTEEGAAAPIEVSGRLVFGGAAAPGVLVVYLSDLSK